ncbi:MAG: N-acetylmuramoyl-L-alanine amidase [Deltaproteobacteria bacterium]|nr:N-acetylmuramoyl-L-alanine amidase [Deltaproteobacteria bacterium]
MCMKLLATIFGALTMAPGVSSAQPLQLTDSRGYFPADLPLHGVSPRPGETPGVGRGVRRVRSNAYLAGQSSGGLAGRTVYLSPGHGWVYRSGWSTQRANLDGYVEDFGNGDGISHYLVPWLLAAGAEVVSVREGDTTTAMVVVDDAEADQGAASGSYLESGEVSLFSHSSLNGYAHPPLPIHDQTNPFALGKNRLIATRASETARATFIPRVPQDSAYNVYIAYSQWRARPSDAHIEVHHAGGMTRYLVDQRRHGGTWVLLGRHVFRAGQDPQRGKVVVTNASGDADTYVSVDAVRLGGGMGLIAREGATSLRARADECSRYHIQYAGAPAEIYNASVGDDGTDDVGARARFADWVHAEGEEAIFLSYHSNAVNTSVRGTETYIYGPNPPDGSYRPHDTVLALGAATLGNALQNELVKDLQREIDPSWKDRGLRSAYFGELNPSHQDEMPAALVEIAYHDNEEDRRWLLTPRFRQVVARALYKGIVRYFAQAKGVDAHFSPRVPKVVAARGSGDQTITVSWTAPEGEPSEHATSYRVYRSGDGLAFDDGIDTAGQTSLRIQGLDPGSVHYLRITALNDAGESLPSPIVVVGVSSGATDLLLVGGFDRLDADLALRLEDDKLGLVKRLDLTRINDGGQLVGYGPALAGLGFDSCRAEALDGSLVDISAYKRIIWAAGRGASATEGLRAVDRARLAGALDTNTVLLISGSNVASTLAQTPAGGALLEALGTLYLSSGANSGAISPVSGSPIEHLDAFHLPLEGQRPYAPGVTDRLEALGGVTLLAHYADDKGAIVRSVDGERCTIMAGFPLETIHDTTQREATIRALLRACPGPIAIDAGVPPPGDRPADADSGATSDHGVGGDRSSTPPPEGCSCQATPNVPVPLGALVLLALALGRRRKLFDAPR